MTRLERINNKKQQKGIFDILFSVCLKKKTEKSLIFLRKV